MNIFQNASIIFWQVRLQRASEGREDHKQRKDCGRSAKHHLLLGERSQVKYQQCLTPVNITKTNLIMMILGLLWFAPTLAGLTV